jgi:hypothetical protein
MAKLEELDGIWADGRFEPKQSQVKKPFLQMRAEFIRKWGQGTRNHPELAIDLDELLREYFRMMAV